MIDTFVQMLSSLRSSNSSNYKKEVLAQYKDDATVRTLLSLTYDPYLNYYVTSPTVSPSGAGVAFTESDLIAFERLLRKANLREVTPAQTARLLQDLLGPKDPDVIESLLAVVKRDLKAGVNVSTINSVMGDLIPDFKTMKGKKWEGKVKPSFPCWGSPKLDGYRGPSFVVNGQRGIYSNEGRYFESYSTKLAPVLQALAQALNRDFVFDGEVMAADYAETSSARAKDSQHQLCYHMFDCLTGWEEHNFDRRPASERYHFMETTVQDAVKTLGLEGMIRVVPHVLLYTEEEAIAFFEKCVGDGYEGAMFVAQHSEYKRDRSADMHKLKPVRKTTVDCEIVEVLSGKVGTKYEHTIGSIVVRGVDENGVEFKANCGSGITDDFRKKWNLKRQELLGQIAELHYDCITQDKDSGEFSIRFPRFKQLRLAADKSHV